MLAPYINPTAINFQQSHQLWLLHQVLSGLEKTFNQLNFTEYFIGIIVTDTLDDLPDHHKKIFHSMLANLNKTWHASLNNSKAGNQVANHDITENTDTEWTSEQIQTVVYIVLAFIIVTSVSIVSGLYMRSISEKRRSAAAIKSLLDLMAENRSLQSVYTMEGVYATANSQNEVMNPSTIKEEEVPSVLKVARQYPKKIFVQKIIF